MTTYSGGYDEVLFPFLKGVKSQQERGKIVQNARDSATEADKQRIYAGLQLYAKREEELMKILKPTGKGQASTLAQNKMKYSSEEWAKMEKELEYVTEQRATAQNYIMGKGDTAGDSFKALGAFAAIAAGAYGGITALGGAVSGGAGSTSLIGGAAGDTLGVSVGTGSTATASSGTGISGWLSSTFGIPTGVTTTASAASTINDIAGVVSGGEGVASIGGAAASGASTFSQILSGVSTVGKIAGAAGSIFELVGGSGAADAYSTFLNADAAKAAATGKARDYNEQAESYDYLASQAGRNRQVSLQNYVAEQQRLAVESERIARATKRAIGSTTAAYGAAGVALESGSVQEVLMDSAAEGELDLAIENFNSKQRQRNYLIEADALAEEEAFNKKNAARARENANLSLEAGNSISDMLRKQGTVQGIEAGVNIIKGAGDAISGVKSVLDLF